ncbi:hypothetical protein GGS21DRAFT_523388 [Xylaria nigripes]|nr:hypothetical protein GGS21DRAFT_523388 [Xylaria nigripes]
MEVPEEEKEVELMEIEMIEVDDSEVEASDVEASEVETSDVEAGEVKKTDQPKLGNVTVALPFSTLTQPKSVFDGFEPPIPEVTERQAVTVLVDSMPADEVSDDYIEFELDSFSIYVDQKGFPNEMRPLQHLLARSIHCMYFDGILRYGKTQFFLRRIPFRKLPVGNYGEDIDSVGDQMWIRSKLNVDWEKEIYYKLGSPAPEYRRYYTPFLWIADLGKHVIDYCDHRREQKERVVLHDFKSKFSTWLLKKHPSSPVFDKWYAANGSADFRVAVTANMDYIWEEAHALEPRNLTWHHLWKEIKTLAYYRPNLESYRPGAQSKVRQGQKLDKDSMPKTVVTPYAYDLFSHMVFGGLLELVKPTTSVDTKKAEFIEDAQSFSIRPDSFRSTKRRSTDRDELVASIQPGDVISTLPDDVTTTDTNWKRRSSMHYQGDYHWFGLVQKVHTTARGKRSFDVLWLYQPIDTPCSVMKYPWANELFLSENCTCHPSIAKVQGHEILATHEVEWFGSPSSSAEFFVRQTYVATECRFASLRKAHLTCSDDKVILHGPERLRQYSIGDTVLVETRTMHLETFVIEGFFEENKTRLAQLRHLLRRKEVDQMAPTAPPNELIYSRQLVNINVKKINRRCLVRAFLVGEEILPPYNRDGTGDAYYFTHEEVEVDGTTEYRPLDSKLVGSFRQGFDPLSGMEKLQGLDLFCGGGNLGRGIEEGGAVEMRWTNDIWEGAIHSYMANAEPDRCKPFLGSVDNLLGLALAGATGVPGPGDVDFISAGSPCPGFSLLTPDKTTIQQRKNQSLIASFASYIDLYRPLYGVLENVPSMVNKSMSRDSCVFSQLVCAIVGLGYQVQVLFLDAWSFGSAQQRSRVFLAFTAPGLMPPKPPKASHSHPANVASKKLGIMSCGRPFDSRKIVPTPYKFNSMNDAVGSLPNIQDGKADYCIGYPDHRVAIGYTAKIRQQLACIPTHPHGMNFSKAWFGAPGVHPTMTEIERGLFPKDGVQRVQQNSKGWGRIDPNGLIGTIATSCIPADARTGRINHWEQNRPITVLEARRAQGFPDHEVLVGTRADQFKVIGNSVSRHVALVLGMSIREAWSNTLVDADMNAQLVQTQVSRNRTRTYTDSSEDILATSPSCSPGVFTPATSESAEPVNGLTQRKRMGAINIELPTKKPRLGRGDMLPIG